MVRTSQHNTGQRAEPDLDLLERVAFLVGMVAALVCALPALIIGLVGAHLLRERSWSLMLWLGLATVGLGGVTAFALHGLGQLIALQLRELIQDVKVHQANLLQWDGARLWLKTWPVWLETLVLAPVIAAFRVLASSLHGGGAASLHVQERLRQQTVARAQRRASRHLRRPSHLPDAVAGHMVMGVPIDDESNS